MKTNILLTLLTINWLQGCSSKNYWASPSTNAPYWPSQSAANFQYPTFTQTDQPADYFIQGAALGVQAAQQSQALQIQKQQRQISNNSAFTVATGNQHWISNIFDGGSRIQLEDGSLWEIEPYYKFDTSIWMELDPIILRESNSGMPGYTHLLINTSVSSGEKAYAKLLVK